MHPVTPIETAPLFPALHAELIGLLHGLDESGWEQPTVAPRWRVRDVAAHLLDGDLRKLSACRDGLALSGGQSPSGLEAVVRLVNSLNASGVEYARRLSPRLLIELLEVSGPKMSAFVASLPPDGESLFAVDWAGESVSANWMDIGREYTERWHHQMQIRDAVGTPGLLERRWLEPLLDISVRALPRSYANVDAADGTAVTLEVEGEFPLAWSLVRSPDGWRLFRGAAERPAAAVKASRDEIWRLFYNALPVENARRTLRTSGETRLAEPLLLARSVLV